MIDSINIKNWKGHRRFECKFKKGLNFIIGPNGIGKSSILEALYYGITGIVKSNEALVKMINIGAEDGFKIELNLKGGMYRIERLFNGKKNDKFYYNEDKVVIKGIQNVKDQLIKIYDTRFVFLKNLFYYGEGDIFKLISDSKKKFNLREYMEDILGIKKVANLKEDLGRLKRNLNKKKKEFQFEIDTIFKYGIEQNGPDNVADKIRKLNKTKVGLEGQKEGVERVLRELRYKEQIIGQKIKNFEGLREELEDLLSLNIFDENISGVISRIKTLIENGKEELNFIDKEIKNLTKKLNRTERKYSLSENIVEIIKYLETSQERDLCPVCEKEFSKGELEKLSKRKKDEYKDVFKARNELESKLKDKDFNFQDLSDLMKRKENLLNDLENLYNEWEEKREEFFNLKKKFLSLTSQFQTNDKNREEIKKKLYEINKNLHNLTIRQNIKKAPEKYSNISFIEREKKKYDNSIYLIDLIRKSIDDTLYNTKNNYLKPLTDEISQIWSKIFNDRIRIASFDENLNPILETNGGKIGFENLSGGEKTILTIITKTLLMYKFSNLNFIVLDEPLEHLDVKNRAQLIDYLLRFYESKFIDQLIITTFEESLTRTLIENENVNIISLGALKKYDKLSEIF